MTRYKIDSLNRTLSSVLSFFSGVCTLGVLLEFERGQIFLVMYMGGCAIVFGLLGYLAFRNTVKQDG